MLKKTTRTVSLLIALISSLPLFAGTPLAATLPAGTPDTLLLEIQGHRGARGNFPENTLPAFEFAMQAGVDVLELDLQVTRDLQVVVGHDPVLNREICLNPDGSRITKEIRVIDLSWSELRQFDCGSLVHPRFPRQKLVPGTRIPSLDEVFEFVEKKTPSSSGSARPIRFNIELKYDAAHPEWWPKREKFAQLVLKRVRHWKLQDRVTLQSFDFEMVKVLRRMDAQITLSYLSETAAEDRVARTLASGAQILSPDFDLLTEAEVRSAHARGLRVIPWTLNSAEQWEKAIRLRVDGIITDYPLDLVKFRATHPR